MPTFATPKPLTERITYALMQLRQARYDGRPECIHVAQRRIQGLCTPCHTAKTHGAAHRARLTRVLTAGGETPLTCDDDNRARGL